jgi:hypothetical protein
MEDELKAWSMTFRFGRDYFRTLKVVGVDPQADYAHFYEKAAEAWERLGSLFMQTWKPDPGRPIPWAVEQFGNPDD